MTMSDHNPNDTVEKYGSTIAPSYSKGSYFANSTRHGEDAQFKATGFCKLFTRVARQFNIQPTTYVDVGCGSGDVVRLISRSLQESGFNLTQVKGYDVSPHVSELDQLGVEYIQGDFCESTEVVDLVTLFDVFEHVPEPIEFIRSVAQKCKFIGFHIPLDNSLNVAMRDMFRKKLRNPGHLIFMDSVYALNLLALASVRVIDYEYSFGFLAPSGHDTMLSKAMLPIRLAIARLNPWLLSKTLGGASLLVIAATKEGLRNIDL